MPTHRFFLFFLFLVSSIPVSAQYVIRGKVFSEYGEELEKVSVRLLNSNSATLTNEFGSFIFGYVNSGEQTLRISRIGYATENYSLQLSGDTTLYIQMKESKNRLDEALVTAQKRESDPYDIPASVSVIHAKEVEQQYIWNIMDITALVPNLNIAHPGDNRNVTSIRGVTTTSYNQAVATYVDGVNQFGLDTYIPYLHDVDRIEVLRGPQGTLYGRNAMGGVINIITKQSTNRTEGFIEANIGNQAQQRYIAGIRLPLLQSRLFFGGSAMFNATNGFYTNEFDGSHYDKQLTIFGNYFLKYLPNQQWAFMFNFKHVSNRNNGAFALVMGIDDAFESPFKVNQNAKTTMIDESRNLSLTINHFGNDVHFSAQTAFQSNYRYYSSPIDGDFSPLDAISIVNNYGRKWNNVNVWTQEFKVSPARSQEKRLNWASGAYLFYQDAPAKQGTYFGEDAVLMGEGTPVHMTSILTNSAVQRGAALYGQLIYRLGKKWELQGGIRYDHEWAKLHALGEMQPDGGELITTQPDTVASADFHFFTPSGSIKYKYGEDRLLYLSYARGARVGGISQLSSDPDEASLRPFAPEYSNNLELGSKNKLWNHRLEINTAVFYSRLTNVQTPTLLLPDAITVTQNTGKVRSMGLEFEARGRITPSLSAWGSAAFVRAEYLNMNMAHGNENIQFKGNRPVFTPTYTGFLGLRYEIPLGPIENNGFQLGIYSKFIGKQYFNADNTLEQNAYNLLNASVGYSVLGYEFLLWGQNITDTRYVDYAYDFGFAAVHLGLPVTYGLTIKKRFGVWM